MSQNIDPRVLRTRKLIQDAFVDLYASKSVKEITIRDITLAAGVNRATFYRHFEDKFDLCDYCVQKAFEKHLLLYVREDAPLTRATFRALVYATIIFIRDWQSQRSVIKDRVDQIMEARVQQMVLDTIMFWIEPNYRKGPCDAGAEVAGTAVSWAIFGVAVRLSQQNTSISVDAVTDELVNMLTGGLWNSLLHYYEQFNPQQ